MVLPGGGGADRVEVQQELASWGTREHLWTKNTKEEDTRNQRPRAKGTPAACPLGVLPGDISSLKSSSQGSWVVVTSTTLETTLLVFKSQFWYVFAM